MINRCTAIASAGFCVVVFSAIGPTASLAQEAATITGRVTNAQGQPEVARTVGGPTAPTGAPSASLPPATGTVRPGGLSGPTVVRLNGALTSQVCTSRGGAVIMVQRVRHCRLPNGWREDPSGGWSEDREMLTPGSGGWAEEREMLTPADTNIGGLNAVNTVEACTARGGQMIANRGVQQCRMPAGVSPRGNPRSSASPPRD